MHHRRGPWSTNEDNQLLQLVQIHGAHNWVRISGLLGSRTPKQCRERYHQNLKPSLNHAPITQEEGQLISKLVAEMGKRWAEIARHLNGRSDNAVKNWWNGGQNRRRRSSTRPSKAVYRASLGHQGHQHDISLSPYSTPSPLPSTGLTIHVDRSRPDDAMVSPGFSETNSDGRTPSLTSDSVSNFSVSPRVPPSPIDGGNTLPPLLNLGGPKRRDSMPNLQAYEISGEPYIVDQLPSDHYYHMPRYGGDHNRLNMFVDACVERCNVPLPGVSTEDMNTSKASKDGRMSVSNLLS